MNRIHRTLAVSAVMLAVALGGCSSDKEASEQSDSDGSTEARGEHDRDGSEHGGENYGEEGEESGAPLSLNESYDQIRNGARLILSYDPQSNSFIGTVENTTDGTLKQVRVEVHLSNGVELGPTTPTDLNPSESTEITLTAPSQSFNRWTAHPEVGEGGSGEHGSGEGEGEHGKKGGGKHN